MFFSSNIVRYIFSQWLCFLLLKFLVGHFLVVKFLIKTLLTYSQINNGNNGLFGTLLNNSIIKQRK